MDHALWIMFISIIVTAIIFWLFGYLKTDPIGKKTIILYNQKERIKWREDRLKDEENLKIKELFLIVGEFGEGSCQIVQKALELNYKVSALSGKEIWCKSKMDIEKFLDYPNFSYFVNTKIRPEKHFMIIGKDLFLEVPHKFNATKKEALGIEDPDEDTLDAFRLKTENEIKSEGVIQIDKSNLEDRLKECIKPNQRTVKFKISLDPIF